MEKMIRELVEKPRYKNRIIVHPDGICAVSCAFGGSRSGEGPAHVKEPKEIDFIIHSK